MRANGPFTGTIGVMTSSMGAETEAQIELKSTGDYARFAAEFLSERIASDIVVINV